MPRVRRSALSALVLALLAAGLVFLPGTAGADEGRSFRHVATFDVIDGNGSAVAEIIDVSPDGNELIYTDADNESIGFIDITDPTAPVGTGTVPVGGEPTSLVIRGSYVVVGVNTSSDFVNPSGKLVVVGRESRSIVIEIELGGQPDSIALAPNGAYIAVVLENERDEDLGGGFLPQLPSGEVLIVDIRNRKSFWDAPEGTESLPKIKVSNVDLSDVAAAAPGDGDLEPEYVDISKNSRRAVVTFQENNYLAVIDVQRAKVLEHFSAGEAELSNVDTAEEDIISLDTDITKRREPDAATWIDNRYFATANEGDYEDEDGVEGGSRGFTIFKRTDGKVVYESAESFEHVLVSAGHYNEGRSENKGVEPEAVEYGTFGSQGDKMELLFVGSERSNAVGVYDVSDVKDPELLQVLPTGIGPEGLKAIPERDLFVVSTEADEAGDGIPTMVNIYALVSGGGNYPQIVSGNDANGLPIPWVALSGLAADPSDADTLYAVNDSFLAAGYIYTIDNGSPAVITDRLEVTGASADLDLEGIAVGPDGNFWLGSEGNAGSRPNLVLKVDLTSGAVLTEIELPADLVDMRRGNGIEGIAVTGEAGAEVVYVAIQRAWPDEGDTDEVNTKIGRYDVATGTWGFVHYPLEAEGGGDWIGLSELTALPDGSFAVIERDKGWGPTTGFNAELKAIYVIGLADAEFRAFDDPAGLVTIEKRFGTDLVDDLAANSIWTPEKLEGLAVTAAGDVVVVTDNDGVDDAPGETVYLNLGDWTDLLGVLD